MLSVGPINDFSQRAGGGDLVGVTWVSHGFQGGQVWISRR